MFLGAILILPEGFDTHPDAHYPLAVYQGHFQREPSGWREQPPDASLPGARHGVHRTQLPQRIGTRRVRSPYAAPLTTGSGISFLSAVDRAFVPTCHSGHDPARQPVLRRFVRGQLGERRTLRRRDHLRADPVHRAALSRIGPWARALYGGSTGGWEALGVQVLYPDQYNGTYAACPDPIDFRQYTNFDIYKDSNAYYTSGPWRRTPRDGERDYLGDMLSTVEQQNLHELALGTHSRSGGQWDIWEAVSRRPVPTGIRAASMTSAPAPSIT